MKEIITLTIEPAASRATFDSVQVTGSFEAFFVEEYSKMVALAAAVSGDRAAAEDIAQEAMSRISRDWVKISGYEKPGAWLRRVTINLALSRKRKLRSEAKAILQLTAEPELPRLQADDSEVWDKVAKLSRMQRAVVALHFLEDLSLEEVADILEINASTARVHLHRAKKSLHEQLSNDLKAKNV